MQRAKQVLQAFKVEMRELPREAAATYDAKAKAHHGNGYPAPILAVSYSLILQLIIIPGDS